MAKKNKVRHLDTLSSDFSDVFDSDDIFGFGSAKALNRDQSQNKMTSPPKNTVQPSKMDTTMPAPQKSVVESIPTLEKPDEHTPSMSLQDLEQWGSQDGKVSEYQERIAELEAQIQLQAEVHRHEQVKLSTELQRLQTTSEVEIANLRTENVRLEQQIQALQATLSRQEQMHSAEQQQFALLQRDLERFQKEEMDRQAAQTESSEWIAIAELLSERGLRTHAEYMAFFKAVGNSSYCWTLWKNAQVQKSTVQAFLSTQVHLISEQIHDVTSIPGVCVPVDNSKCEISGGVLLLNELREMVTEVLLQGWNRLLILGAPKKFVTFLRNNLAHGTIEVQIDPREEEWTFIHEMGQYPLIVVLAGDAHRIPSTCKAKVIAMEQASIGEVIQTCRQSLQED